MHILRTLAPTIASASLLLAASPGLTQVPIRPSVDQDQEKKREEEQQKMRPGLKVPPRLQQFQGRQLPGQTTAQATPPRVGAPPSATPPGAQPGATPPSPTQPVPPTGTARQAQTAAGPGAGGGTARTPEEQQRTREEARRRGKFQLNFDKAEIADVVQTMSDFTGKLFIVPENIRGKITIVGPENGTGLVTADQAYAAFLSALEANNWTVYPVGQYLKLVEKRAAPNSNVWTYTDPKAPIPDDERMVTKVLKLRYVDVDTIANPLKQLASKDASLIPLPPDTLIVTEVALNLRRIERIVQSLDQPGGGDELRIIQVDYANATELADKLLQIFEANQGGGGGRTATRRAAPTPAAPGAPPAAGGAEGAGGTISITRVIPDERTNKLIVIASSRAFDQIEAMVKQLDVPTGDTGRVNVYYLENASAEDLAATLQGLTTGGTTSPAGARPGAPRRATTTPAGTSAQTAELFSGEVKISADKATNSLVVVASAQDYKNLVKVIERLDIPRRQVFVEAVIMEVNLNSTDALGFSFHGGATVDTTDGIAPIIVGSQLGQASSLNLSSLVSLGGFLAGIQGPPIPAASELGVALPSFGLVMHALTNSSDVNVLSTPHILTSDNEEAEITVGQNVPFQAGFAPQGLSSLLGGATGGTTGNNVAGSLLGSSLLTGGLSSLYAPIQRQNVELKLKIKPQINESDYVRMQVEEQTEEIAQQDPQLGPTTAKRTAKTVVVAKDQTTVVIGGLIQERTINSVQKTPILGDIPVIGRLFRDTSTNKIKTNLLLFLTPYIIRDQTDFRRIFERKMKERDEFVAAFYGTAPEYEVPVDYARKAGPVALLSRDVQGELQKVENGGPGAAGQREIRPQLQVVPRGSVPPGEAPTETEPQRETNAVEGTAPGEVSPGEATPNPEAAPAVPPAEDTTPVDSGVAPSQPNGEQPNG